MPFAARVTVSSACDMVGDGDVALTAQLERRDRHLVLVAKLLAGPQPEPTKVDRRHAGPA